MITIAEVRKHTPELQSQYTFYFTIHSFDGSVRAISVEQAVSRAKAIYIRDGVGYKIGSPLFKAAMANLRGVPVNLELNHISRQRFSELYREQYQIGITDPHAQAEFAQLEDIVNKLKQPKG